MFQQLLLAVDDSPSGQVAISFASALAQSASASVHVLYVNEYLVGGRGLTLHSRDEATELVADAIRELRAAGVAATGAVHVATYQQVAERIVDEAQEYGADAIVLGSSRNRRLARLFSHRLRDRATRLTALPIITSPPPLKLSLGRLELLDAVQQERNKVGI